jgi:hypothetical protein
LIGIGLGKLEDYKSKKLLEIVFSIKTYLVMSNGERLMVYKIVRNGSL